MAAKFYAKSEGNVGYIKNMEVVAHHDADNHYLFQSQLYKTEDGKYYLYGGCFFGYKVQICNDLMIVSNGNCLEFLHGPAPEHYTPAPGGVHIFSLKEVPENFPYKNFNRLGQDFPTSFGPHNLHEPMTHKPWVEDRADRVYDCYFHAGLRVYDISDPYGHGGGCGGGRSGLYLYERHARRRLYPELPCLRKLKKNEEILIFFGQSS